MSYLRGFLPWIVFSVVSSFAWQWAALIALATSAYFLVRDRRAGVTADAQILDFGTIAFFATLTAVAFADPHSPVQAYESGLSSAWLALIAGVSLLVRQPFTLGIAKRRTTPEVWKTAAFRHLSFVLTSVWACGFAASAVVTLICEANGTGVPVRVIVQILGFAVPATFTHYHVKTVRARAAATTQVLPAVGR
ncbi:hypothetical protein LWP59_25105 [Amycolatopsis acidiphila]|uniref:DUF3159 domain-containing protein n=1 Tax=Amycolatopsis acidiphila TaxID=715473 RepID=A0A558ALB9_9PSEU|nr:hypothetical protein [Amycolatopsis acidiphila]TVT25069.1 hypothetical protein FNH06_04435 [Amycolatopsis acidiphila]UIJ57419.1 hypothetical protein LWP59_25105 [Amycolatopsis acidiphila]GHG84337.1 hypothetical protein GCM10017788_56170 [Amycolatopsis acidiphila]